MSVKGIPDELFPDDLEPVPSITELVKQQLAVVIERNAKGEVSIARPTPEGQALINEIMSRNAARVRAVYEGSQREAAQDDPPDQ